MPFHNLITDGRKASALARNVIKFIEKYCMVVEGPMVGSLVTLADWQKDLIYSIYRTDAHGVRATRRVMISVGRRQGKSFLTSMLVLVHLIGPAAIKRNGTIISAALSRDQAALIFRFCKLMIEMNPVLSARIRVKDSTKELIAMRSGNTYKAIASEARSALGRSVDLCIYDEIGSWYGQSEENLYTALETSTASSISPLSIMLSTAGSEPTQLFNRLVDDALHAKADNTVVAWHTVPMDKDIWDEKSWKLAMPALGQYCSVTEIRDQAERAKRIPSEEPKFRNLLMNQRVMVMSGFMTQTMWESNNKRYDEDDILDKPCFAGLDLSSTTDLTAFCAAFQLPDGSVALKAHFWLPREGIEAREMIDKAPYLHWEAMGYLTLVPGKVIHFSHVVDFLIEFNKKHPIDVLAYDRWGIERFEKEMATSDFHLNMRPHGQGYKDMNPAVVATEQLFLSENIRHNFNPVLLNCFSHAAVRMDPAGNRKLDKEKSQMRIDGAVAAVMAIHALSVAERPVCFSVAGI